MNSVSLIGRLTRDVELRHTPAGTSVASFGLAVDRAGDKQDDGSIGTGFFDVTMWGKTAETAAQYLVKGRQIGVTGELHHHRWTSETGENRAKVEVVGRAFTFCGSKSDGDGGNSSTGTSFVPVGAAADDDIPF